MANSQTENQLILTLKNMLPGKYEADVVLKKIDYPTKSGSEHIQQSLFSMADEKDY